MDKFALIRRGPDPAPRFKLGDRVALNSGSSELMIVDLDGIWVTVAWQTEDESGEEILPAACFTLVEAAP